ncbi:MAG: hypothetical protein IKO99_08060 [Bacteroidales bacterium]|nr:hypothetical protein [Bacteroidales bacterium]
MKRKIFLFSAKLLFLMTVFLSFAPKNTFGQNVFTVGEHEYSSLSAAINAANSDEKSITQLRDYTSEVDEDLSTALKQNLNLKGFTLDLNGKTLKIETNEVTITGTGEDDDGNPTQGKITSSNAIVIESTSELHIKDVTIKTTNTTEDEYVNLINNSAKITLYEGTVITGGNNNITPFRTYNYSSDKRIAFVGEDCEIVGDDDYVLDYGGDGFSFYNSEGQFCGGTLTVQKAEYFEASYGTEKKIFGTLEKALTADYGGVNDVTITLIHNYRRNFDYFDKTHVDAGNNTIKYIEPRYNFTLDFTPASIIDTLAVKIKGKTLTIKGDGSTDLYAHFELENSATLNINGGNYDFYTEIIHITSGCSATISSSNTNFVTLSICKDMSGLNSCIPSNTYYDYIINDGGNLTINNGSFSYDEDENLTPANRDAGRGVYTENNGTTEIKGGTFTGFAIKQETGSAWKYISFHPAYISDGTINISGGTFSGSDYGLYAGGSASAEITGGEFSGLDFGININQSDYDYENQKSKFVIKGGTFIGTDNDGIGIYAGEMGSAEVLGGTFTGKTYGISSYMSHISLSGGTFSGDNAAVNIDYDNYNTNLLNEGYAYYAKNTNGEYDDMLEEKYSDTDPYNLLDADNQTVKDVKVDKAKTIFTLGKGAKYNFENSAGNTFAPITNSDGKTLITATQESGKWYVNTTEYVVDGSTYTLKAKEDENVYIEITIKDYFKDVLEQKWYRAITVYTGSKFIYENAGFYKDDNNTYYGQTISTDIETDHKIYVNGETTDENNFSINVDGDGKTEVTLELRDDDGNVYALKKRTVNFDSYKPSITIECDGVAVPKVSTHDAYNSNEVIILPDSKLSFKFDDNKAPDGSTLTGDKISAFSGIIYNDGTNDHVFIDSTTAATGIDAKNLAGKTVIYYAFDKAGNGLEYGDSLKVTFALAKFKATYKQDNKDVTKYFTNLKDALTSSNYPGAVTDITIETLENEITDQSTDDIEVEDKTFVFSPGNKECNITCNINVISGKLTINGGKFNAIVPPAGTTSSYPVLNITGGELTVTGGEFTNAYSSVIQIHGGTTTISGGKFSATGTAGYGLFYGSESATVKISSTVNDDGEETACPEFIGQQAAIYNYNSTPVLADDYAFYSITGGKEKVLTFSDDYGNRIFEKYNDETGVFSYSKVEKDVKIAKIKTAEITAEELAALLSLTKEYDGKVYARAKTDDGGTRELYNGGSDTYLVYKGLYLQFHSINYDDEKAGENKTITAKTNLLEYTDNENGIFYTLPSETIVISTLGVISTKALTVISGITAEDKTYDGTTDAALNFENAVLSGLIDGDDKPAITATGTFEDENAGENKTVTISEIKIKLNEGEVSNYKIATADNQSETTATITAKKVESPVITIDVEEIVYNGEAQKPAITVKDGETVIPSDEFEITYENNTDAGTATIKITDKNGGNYVISDKETTFEIAKANPEFSKEPESAGALSFTGQAQPLLTAGETSDGEILYRLGEDGEYSSEIPSASAPGVYTVYCKIVGDKNHNDSEEDFKVTVRILQQTVSYTLGKNAEIKLPYPETVVFTSDNSNVSVTDNVLKTTSSVKDGDKAVLTSENYVISVTIVEPLKSIEIEDIWHNGDVHLKAPDMSAFDEGSELHINGHKVEDIENEVISEEGENTVVYEIKDPESNIICHEERIIKIDKSAPDTKAEASSVNKTRYNITVTVDGGMKYFFRNGAEAGFNVTDLFSGVKSMEYSWDNKDNFQNLDPSTLVGLKSGAHTLYIRVSDNAGNTEILSADFTVFDDSKFANGSDTVISLPVYYSSDEIESQTFDINLNGNTVFAIKDSKDGVYYGKTTDGVYFTGNVLTVTSDYLKTLKPDGENMLYVYINPLGGEGWNEDFTPKDYECQIMKIKLDIIYEVRVNGDYKFTAPNDNSITTFCDGEDVMLTFTLDTKYSKADFVSIETMEVYNEDLKEQITFRIPKGALKGGNEPLKLTFRKESYTADDTVTFPGDYPSEYNIKVYDDVIAIDNSGQHFLNDQYTWFIDMKEIPGETKQFLDLLKYMTDGQKHSFSVKVVDVTGGSFRVCPDESFTIESIGKRKAVSVNVYPNPAESGKMFYIELENFGEENFPNTEILIYNQLGTVVEKISAVEKLNPVSLNAGFYSGTVLVSGKKMLNFKIIVK